jgi:hypothetical protein
LRTTCTGHPSRTAGRPGWERREAGDAPATRRPVRAAVDPGSAGDARRHLTAHRHDQPGHSSPAGSPVATRAKPAVTPPSRNTEPRRVEATTALRATTRIRAGVSADRLRAPRGANLGAEHTYERATGAPSPVDFTPPAPERQGSSAMPSLRTWSPVPGREQTGAAR